MTDNAVVRRRVEYDVTQVLIPVDDEAVLAGDVMFPSSPGPHRVLVSLYPYHKDDVIGGVFDAPRRALAEAGFATLLVDMRGHGASSGFPGASYDLGGTEGADGAAVVEWAYEQPWCSGGLGMWGVSYGAMTSLATAARRPPHLRAIVAVYGTNDCFHDAIAPGGSFFAIGRYSWVAHMLGMDLFPPTRVDEEGDWLRLWTDRLDRIRKHPGHAFVWQPHLEDEQYWAARTANASNIEVPTLLIGGWQDLYLDAIVRLFQGLPSSRRLVIGPWTHVVPDLADREPIDWIAEMCAWWDAHLEEGGESTKDERSGNATRDGRRSEAVVHVGGFGWRSFETWPPSGSEITLYPATDHGLEASLPASRGELAFTPTRLTGQSAGLLDPLGTGLGRPKDQHYDDLASLNFTTGPLLESLEISGSPELDLAVTAPVGTDLRLVAKLCDVSPDDSSVLLSNGWRRVILGDSSTARIQVHCTPAAVVVPAGHRLRLSLSSADFPRFWPSPGEGSFSVAIDGGELVRLTIPLRPSGQGEQVPQIRRPAPAPDQGWNVSSTSGLRQLQAQPGGEVGTQVHVENELLTPHGTRVCIREQFTARAALGDPAGARVDGDVAMGIDLANGGRVEISVVSEFSETTARATATVLLDGKTLLDEEWSTSEP